MSHDERTRTYVERRTAEGKSKKEIMRCLKRYIAREVFHAITNPPTDLPPRGTSLRELRTSKGLSLQAVADIIDTNPTRLSNLERELVFDTRLARRAHHFLRAA
jgi:transposase